LCPRAVTALAATRPEKRRDDAEAGEANMEMVIVVVAIVVAVGAAAGLVARRRAR
jgi:hypothetical protein